MNNLVLVKHDLVIKPKFFPFIPDLIEYRDRLLQIFQLFEISNKISILVEELGTLIKDIMTIEKIDRMEAIYTVQFLIDENIK